MTKDDPWRFVIVLACGLTLFFSPSTLFSNGVFLVAYKDTGLYSDSAVSWLFSVNFLVHAFAGPICSLLIRLTSCRTVVFLAGLCAGLGFALGSCSSNIVLLFVTYGILLGLGRGMSFAAGSIVVGYWFPTNSSLPTGLMFAGVGCGMLVHPRLSQAFVDWYDVHGAQLLMGALSFHTCICGLLLRPSLFERRRESVKVTDTKKQTINAKTICKSLCKGSIFKNVPFLFFALAACLFIMAFNLVIVYMPDYFNHHGSTPQESALAASISGGGSLLSRILIGILTNDSRIGTMVLFIGNCGLSGILTLLLPLLVQSPAGRILYALCVGIYLTSLFVVLGPTTLQKLGLDDLAYGFGMILMFSGIVSLIGPPLAVEIRKLTNSYYSTFVLIGCLLLGCCVSGFLSEYFSNPRQEDEDLPMGMVVQPLTLTIENTEEDLDETDASLHSREKQKSRPSLSTS